MYKSGIKKGRAVHQWTWQPTTRSNTHERRVAAHNRKTLRHAPLSSCVNGCVVSLVRPWLTLISLQRGMHPFDGERVDLERNKPNLSLEATREHAREGLKGSVIGDRQEEYKRRK